MEDAVAFKAYLMKQDGPNLYEPLSRLLVRVMDERPQGAGEMLQDLLDELRSGPGSRSWFGLDKEIHLMSEKEERAEKQKPLFTKPQMGQEDELFPLPNVSKMAFFLEQAGVGLGQLEILRISLAVRQLVETEGLPRCRLWGKVLGTWGSYIVVEADFREGEQDFEPEPEPEEEHYEDQAPEGMRGSEGDEENAEGEGAGPLEPAPLPQSTYRPPPPVPREALGTGANRFLYFVCSEPGLAWVKLPPVTPAQITAARKICKMFTGNLESPVISFPPFPGTEMNYLRAQIARISAGTHVSPDGFYQLGDEDACEANPDFEDVPVAEMCELSAWVHHMPHILQQGRCTWVNMSEKQGDESEEEGEGDEDEEEGSEEPEEIGPQLLTPLSMDAELFGVSPWTCRMSSALIPQHAVAVLRSNLWPGAFAYGSGKEFDNFYVGWGLKYRGGAGFSAPILPPPQKEYPEGPDLMEAIDPSVEDEQALKDALEEQQLSEDLNEDSENEEDDD